MDENYEFPSELEPYRSLISHVPEGDTVENVMNRYYNDLNPTQYMITQGVAVQSQIMLLRLLHGKRMLRDLSAWVCKTPYPETSKFCGKPGEHPDFWGCGYQKVD